MCDTKNATDIYIVNKICENCRNGQDSLCYQGIFECIYLCK